MVEAYWLAAEKCQPGELYLIGADEKGHIYTFREALEKLLEMSVISDKKAVKIETDRRYTRPTNVPRLIGDTSKFRKLTGWKPKIGFEQILKDTLKYWRDIVKSDISD